MPPQRTPHSRAGRRRRVAPHVGRVCGGLHLATWLKDCWAGNWDGSVEHGMLYAGDRCLLALLRDRTTIRHAYRVVDQAYVTNVALAGYPTTWALLGS